MKDKKWTVLMATTFLATLITTEALANDFGNHPFKVDIENAISKGVIQGGVPVNPNAQITRAEFTSLLVKAFGGDAKAELTFKDVPKNHPYYQDIQKAIEAGLVGGYSTTEFRPDQRLTREETALMILRFIKMKDLEIPNVEVGAFKDKDKMWYGDLIQDIRKIGIIAGYEDNTFRPKKPISKAETIAFLMRSIEKVEVENRFEPGEYTLSFKAKPAIEKISFNDAIKKFSKSKEDAYIELNGEVIDMTKGFARTKAFTLIYDEKTNKDFTYVTSNVEMDVLRIVDDKVLVSIAGYTGYVFKKDVTIIPFIKPHERSHYISQGDSLYHRVYNGRSYDSYKVGESPLFLEKGMPYYTSEGYVFDGEEAYQYFNYLPLRLQSNYSGEDLNRYIAYKSPDSPLNGQGDVFVKVAKKYNMNAMYLLANGIHESGWGKSKIAVEKNNLFGFKAVDGSAFEGAASFSTLEEGIDYVASYISSKYLTPGNWVYQNAVLGNKGIGMNVKYASDPYWGAKIAGHMNDMDDVLGGQERNKYKIGKVLKGASMYVKSGDYLAPIISTDTIKIVAVLGLEKINGTDYIKVTSDDVNYDALYVLPSQFSRMQTN